MKRRTLIRAGAWAGAAWAGFGASSGLAQFRVDIAGVGMTQIPIAVAVFRGEQGAPQSVSGIVRADLERSGQFRLIEAGGGLDETSSPNLPDWRARNADALAAGSVTRLADGRYDVRFRLWDAVRATDLGGQAFAVVATDLRLAAHRIADLIYEKLTGDKGVFSTRIAYVTRTESRYALYVADADGENAQAALSSVEPIISPTWSPNGTDLAYVSFETRKPVVYVHEVASGRRRAVANFRGSNSAPAWSPDGRQLAVVLTRDGLSQIYVMNRDGAGLVRLASTPAIDTEPAYSADGKLIYFVSDRGGTPQIYRMPAQGGQAERITFSGGYNISPSLSPDGRWMAFISRVDGSFRLHVMDLANGAVTALTDARDDESPSFAPNSRVLIYASRVAGRDVLMTTSIDGRVKARLAGASADVREPAWGPYDR